MLANGLYGKGLLSPSTHRFDDELIDSGLSAALGHELGPNGVSNISETVRQNTSPYLRIEALSAYRTRLGIYASVNKS
jgi:hypothetical protein